MTPIPSTYQPGDTVYMRYQGDITPNGNRGKIVAISEVAENAYHYTIETASGRQHTGLCDDTLSARPIPVPTIETAVRVLNEALAADPAALHALACNRVPANAVLLQHPEVLVDETRVLAGPTVYTVGMLGVLNGVLEAMTGQRVAAVYDDNGQEIVEFRVYDPAAQAGAASAEASQ